MGGRFYRPLLFSMASDGCGPGAPLPTSSRAAATAGAAAASLASEAAARGTPGVSPEQQPWARLPSLGSLSSLHSANGAFQVPSRLPAHTSDSLSRHDPGPCAFPHRPRGSEEPRCFHLTRRTSSRQLQAPRGNSEWQTQAGPSASWPPPADLNSRSGTHHSATRIWVTAAYFKPFGSGLFECTGCGHSTTSCFRYVYSPIFLQFPASQLTSWYTQCCHFSVMIVL